MTEPTLRTSAEMIDRMVALVRYITEHCDPNGDLKFPVIDGPRSGHVASEAYAIVAMLPEPVDPDIQLSRNIAADADAEAKTGTGVDYCDYMRSGEYDHDSARIAAFDGLKRGRELASA